MINSLLLTMFERLSIIAILAFFLSKASFFKNILYNAKVKKTDLLLAILIFAGIGILGTYTGVPIKDAIANSRVIGPMVGGLIGGPIVGFGAGLIAGLHRLTLGGFTATTCGISTALEGLLGGLIRKYYKGEYIPWELAFFAGVLGESMQMGVILLFAKPYSKALDLVNDIGMPMTVTNAIGITVFMMIVKSVLDEKENISAALAKLSLEIANKTLPFLRNGLNEVSAYNTAKIIYESTDLDAVALTDTSKILAHVGVGDDHHKSSMPIQTSATKNSILNGEINIAMTKEEIGCSIKTCQLNSVVIVPLKCFNNTIGTLKLYRAKKKVNRKVISSTDIELAKGLAQLISYQIEIAQVEEQKKLASQAKLIALASQMNPHFLFNTLNTVISFIRTNPQLAREILINLSEYLRYNLKNIGSFITIEKELEIIKSYLYIEKARFGSKIEIKEEIDESLLNEKIPAFILQPLVENSIKHSMPLITSKLVLTIKIKREDSYIHFSVTDNGPGINQEKLQHLFDTHYKSDIQSQNSAGIGIKNVNERLVSIFGNISRLHINTREGKGTNVHFLMPLAEIAHA
ncbi:two-component system, LytT family, sensor histidine kinase LytS [Desulfurella multipotens]|uniref:histidine kinase n=1 Tax=Desulfurella multipotens TaxID=79269 RepID=A0A1G6K7S3_9BACT|nr:sensor histidine kinase [Desulfurella multipotens]SDC26376.1 two-component system, LytT family, sensor histidine kinase LytS [Desulfurella multipotens]